MHIGKVPLHDIQIFYQHLLKLQLIIISKGNCGNNKLYIEPVKKILVLIQLACQKLRGAPKLLDGRAFS